MAQQEAERQVTKVITVSPLLPGGNAREIKLYNISNKGYEAHIAAHGNSISSEHEVVGNAGHQP